MDRNEENNIPNVTEKDLSWNELKQILDNSYDEIFVVDAEGITIYVNEASIRNYGASPNTLIGKPVQSVETNGYCMPVLAPVFLKINKRITLQQSTVLGKILTVTSTPVYDEHGKLKFVVLNSRDVTDIEALNNDLKKSRQMVEEYRGQVKALKENELTFAGIIAESKDMKSCLDFARRVGKVDCNVLILGESGVGKNLLADYIHKVSERRKGRLVHINCASIPEHLLESELFGYRKGAFSGANKEGKPGLVGLANNGTLFLDEIGALPVNLQAKLLQVVQEHRFTPLGGTESVEVDMRIIAATNIDVKKAINEGSFREDLFFRLSVMEVNIPPLRERKKDIPFLVNFFLNRYNMKYRTYCKISPETSRVFELYSWPGNIREMEHLIERLVLLGHKEITIEDLPTQVRKDVAGDNDNKERLSVKGRNTSYRELEIKKVLELYEELQSSYKVANALDISQSKAIRIINKYYKDNVSS